MIRPLLLFIFSGVFFSPGGTGDDHPQKPATSDLQQDAILYGRMSDHRSRQPVADAILTVRRSVLACFSDNRGGYRLSLKTLPDTTSLVQLLCTAPQYRSTGILIRGAVHGEIRLDIELVKGEGHQSLEYRVDPVSKQALLVNAD